LSRHNFLSSNFDFQFQSHHQHYLHFAELIMDDLLALMEDDQPCEAEEPTITRKSDRVETVAMTRTSVSSKPLVPVVTPVLALSSSRAEASIDAKLGIRMINRKIGSIDLLDLVSTNP
jgi:hypothetical protein